MIEALAGELNLNVCFVTLDAGYMSDAVLIHALTKLPHPCILVFEDIETKEVTKITPSTQLNAFDGIIAPLGVLTILTASNITMLTSKCIRRINRRFKFTQPEREELAEYFRCFYENASDELALSFADKIMQLEEIPRTIAGSLATLQQLFIWCRNDDAETTVGKVDDFFEEFFSDQFAEDISWAESLYI